MASKVDAIQQFGESLRSKGGLEVRWGVLDGRRVEFYRGKDFARFFKANPDKCSKVLLGGKGEDEQARALGELLLRRGVVLRCDRMVKKPLPGSKRMVKFPKKLVLAEHQQRQVFDEGGFYAFAADRPASAWAYVWAALAVAGVLAACMFPLAPPPVKVAVFYLCAGLLVLIVSVLALRSLVAAASWIATGSTVWLLPNLLSEELPIWELFRPVVSLEPPNCESKWGSHPLVRAGVGAALAAFVWLLYAHSPDKASVARSVMHSRDELFDWLKINPDIKLLSNTSAATGNATAGNVSSEEVAAANASDARAAAAADEAGEAAEAADTSGAGDAHGSEQGAAEE